MTPPTADLVWCEEGICSWVGSVSDLDARGRCPVCGSRWLGHDADGEWVSPPRPTDPADRYDGFEDGDDELVDDGDVTPDPVDFDVLRALGARLDVRSPPTPATRIGRGDELASEPCPDARDLDAPFADPPEGPVAYGPVPPGTEAAWEVSELEGPPASRYAVLVGAVDLWRYASVYNTAEVTAAGVAVANSWIRGRPLTPENQVAATGIALAVRALVWARGVYLRDPGDATWH
jgi:hypothetical protein